MVMDLVVDDAMHPRAGQTRCPGKENGNLVKGRNICINLVFNLDKYIPEPNQMSRKRKWESGRFWDKSGSKGQGSPVGKSSA